MQPAVALTKVAEVAQGAQAAAPPSEYVLAPHGRHCVDAVAPALAEYVPAGHGVQLVAPPAEEKEPAGQLVQPTTPAAPNWPATHAAPSVQDEAPAVEELPAGQRGHDAPAAAVTAKVPAAQLAHVAAPSSVAPAGPY